ncbi:hypothetical protein [Bacillus amyloliquefaciens]|uniref:hypothetical protein n=1 Tax=Bacillus amyloliquefaciens TaxID=1390 RepID=UPI00200E1905|nr:hypothetical protein [Bacillus amyloliquefaciens]
MCGIVGYIGQLDAKEILLKGLEKLEYRGYDSAGIAVANEQGVHVYKEKGRIADLREVVDHTVESQAGIGHTRWGDSRRTKLPERSPASKRTRPLYTCS